MSKKINKSNPRIGSLVDALRAASRSADAPVWLELAKRLSTPTRGYVEVNVSRLNRHTSEGDTVVVPGVVLGAGILGHSVKVGALRFSQSAVEKIEEAEGACMSIEQMLESEPDGKKIRVFR
ncbi:MAG: 50S ribosomal protein L18e [Methermicoccaceae archaeon]